MKVNFGFCAPRKVADKKKGRHLMNRYETMPYVRCGRSGLRLSRVAFGLWHNFGTYDDAANMARLVTRAFDLGITHFDLANNYGPEPGSAEENFGRLLNSELKGHRDELIVTTKAGHPMWPGPYGDWGSRKSLIASLDQSLKRMKIDYVDIFYSHRPDPETPLEETMGALSDIVRAGKALYVGISKYSAAQTREVAAILKRNGTPLLIHQFRYNMFTRGIESDGLLDALEEVGAGGICFSPLAQGLLGGEERFSEGRHHHLGEARAASEAQRLLRSTRLDAFGTRPQVESPRSARFLGPDRSQPCQPA